MKQIAYCLFKTPVGSCGIAWSEPEEAGASPAVAFLRLPEETAELTEARIARQSGGDKASAAPPCIAEVIEQVCRHLRGEVQDFRNIGIELDGAAPFARQVYAAAPQIPTGRTTTYGALAKVVGRPGAARAVGQALGKNPIAVIIPCHRILAADGKAGGFSAPGGRATKAWLLAIEGATFGPAFLCGPEKL